MLCIVVCECALFCPGRDCQGIQVVRHPYSLTVLGNTLAPCRHLPGQRDRASGGTTNYCIRRGFIYHSTRLHLAHFLPLTQAKHTPRHAAHPSIYIPVCQPSKDKSLPGSAVLLEGFSCCRALPSTKGRWFHPYHQRSCQPRYVFPSPYHTVAPGPPMPSSASSLGHGPADSY